MTKPILISGIQPTGRLHLGNYLGALKNFVELQNSEKYDCYFFIADYHSLTVNYDPKEKADEILDVANAYIAAGLDPRKSTIFIQSEVPESTELAWILNTIAPIGELERMTQYKDKATKILHGEAINTGLLTYPLLMAADILLYNAGFVPVGEDQVQHLELTRTLARKFNNKFGATFLEPHPILAKTPKIRSLDSPARKMSKTLPKGCLFLDDDEREIEKKIKSAVTDSENKIKYDKFELRKAEVIGGYMYDQPNLQNSAPHNETGAGISNLIEIYTAFSGMPISAIEEKYKGKGYGDFKKDLIKIVSDSLKPFRELRANESKLKTILNAGAKKAQKIASAKIKEVKTKLGLLQ